jgi:hypothetical protein
LIVYFNDYKKYMEIENKDILKQEIKNNVDKYIKQFPIYFFGNILINVILIVSIAAIAAMGISSFFMPIRNGYGDAFVIGLVILVFLLAFLRIMLKGFLSNLRILGRIKAGDYIFAVEDYEMDNAVELIAMLPMEKEDIDKTRVALSYNKIIDVFETVGIIERKNTVLEINIVFKYQVDKAMGKFIGRV